MGKINSARVFLGGLLAGLVINIGEYILNVPVLGAQWDAAMQALNRPPIGGNQIVWFVITGFVLGIAAVWFYAAIRPRFGPGPRTALLAGFAVWFFAGLLWGVNALVMGVFPKGPVLTSTVWGLFELPIATAIGAWLYRE